MADRSRQPYKPLNRRNYYSPSSSSRPDSTNSIRSNDRNSSKPDFNSSRIPRTKETTSRTRVSHYSSRNDRGDDDQSLPNLVGTCRFMCPVEEKERRERLRDLAVFERLHGDPAKTSPGLAVKKFCRTIDTRDVHASHVRPVPVLEETLNYLLNLLHSSDRPFEVVHDFIFDRTRSIRQDLSMQNATSDEVIHMYERMVKFHILSHRHLHGSRETGDTASMCHLNLEQLMKTLTTLYNLYEVSRVSHPVFQNEAEFRSLYLLLHLASNTQSEPLSLWLSCIPSPILKSKEMCFARRILRYYHMGNYKRFIFTVEEEASYLQYCIVEPYINEVRILALSCVIYGGYKLQPYPLGDLSKLLMLKESDVESLCIDCALEISNDGTGKGLLPTKQSVISKPSRGFWKYYPIDSERISRLCAETLVL